MSTQEPTTETEAAPASTEEEAEVSIAEVTDVAEEEFRNSIRSARGCVVEKEVPCDLYTSMSAELVEWRHGQWYPTGNIVDNRNRWGVRVRFGYWGRVADCLTGDIKITVWWDGFSNLPEGHKDHYIRNVDPCAAHRYEVVIPMTGELECPDHQGVYDIAMTLDFLCCRKPLVLGHCDLEAIRVTC